MRQDLVLRAQAGDHDAFTTLVASSLDRLYGGARLILRDDGQAQDAVQDAMLRAWRGLKGLRQPARFDAWLYRLVVHACYRIARREGARRIVEVRLSPFDDPSVPDGQHSFLLRDQLERGFRRLSPEQRAVLVLRFYLDLSDADAAEVLGIPAGTLKSRLNRATHAMRAALAAEERTPVQAEGPQA
ncbi:MAG: RNA polymerase sigma factor [Candidatus Limnocylindrales bacterium]